MRRKNEAKAEDKFSVGDSGSLIFLFTLASAGFRPHLCPHGRTLRLLAAGLAITGSNESIGNFLESDCAIARAPFFGRLSNAM